MMYESNEIIDLIRKEAQNIINETLRGSQILVMKVAEIAQYDSVNNRAKVYFPTDPNNASSWYPNKTGSTLTIGSKVYIYHKYGDVQQGFILIKH